MATKYNNTYDAPDNNKNLNNAMEAIKRITGYKDQWHSTDDKATADSVAKKAQVYYKMLADSGYADIADALSKTDNVGAKKIYDDFMKNNSVPSTPTTTTTTTPTDTSNGVETVKFQMPETPADVDTVNGKINHMWGVQGSNMGTLLGKYDTLEEYIYGNPFERDEGKSIMTNYQFKGKTASDNAVASGGASNGGNIDSYAAANANRQQLAFTNAGTQAVLSANSERINQLRGMLNDLGVQLDTQYDSMHKTIGLQQGEEQRVFENDETSKNNQVDRDVKTSEVTGYVPESMSYANNPYLNDDGTVIDPKNNDFSLIKHNAEEALKNETDPQRIADLKQTIKWAEQARLIKTEMPEYSKWRNTTTAVAPDETLTSKVTNKELDYNKSVEDKKLDTTRELTQAELEAQERMNNADNATTLAITDKQINSSSGEDEVDWSDFSKIAGISNNDIATRNFITHNLQPMINEGLNLTKSNDGNDVYYTVIDENGKSTTKSLKDLLINNSSTITKDGAKKIWDALGLNGVTWVDNYSWYDPDGQNNFTPE